jgi:leucine dehydrogenase
MDHPDFDAHETVLFATDRTAKLRAIIAIHDTRLGPGLGGVRMYPYATEAAALTDVLRLSRGMSYKNAMAGLPRGGAQAVIIGDTRHDRTERLLIAYATQVNLLGGRFITAEDFGMALADLKFIARHSPYVTGVADANHQGGPGPTTALGVYHGMRAAVHVALGRQSLSGLTVAIQGLGSVGWALAQRLHADGVQLVVADTNPQRAALAAEKFSARAISHDEILTTSADVLSPCALGGVLNAHTIARLKVAVICGCANNQLANRTAGEQLREQNILYAPDYVVNAGGVIAVASEYLGQSTAAGVTERIERIYQTTLNVLERAREEQRATSEVADSIARRILDTAPVAGRPPRFSDSQSPVESW